MIRGFLSILFYFFCSLQLFSQNNMLAPASPKIPVTDTVHGFILTDDYRWLENKNDPKVIEWTRKQHEYCVESINKLCPEIKGLKEEIASFLDRDEDGAPFWEGDYLFRFSRKKGELQNKLYVKKNDKDVVIFDPLKIDPSGKSAITEIAFSKKGDKIAVGVQYKGNEIDNYYLVDVVSGKQIGKVLENVDKFSWARNEKFAYISIRNQEIIDKQLPINTYLYKIGTELKEAKFLMGPDDAKDYVSVWDALYDSVTFYSIGDFYSNTLKIKKNDTKDELIEIYSSKKWRVHPQTKNNKLYFLSNDAAPNFKIMVTDLKEPLFKNWKEFYSEKETVLDNFILADKYVFVQDKKDIMTRLMVYDYEGKQIKELALPDFGNISHLKYRKKTDELYVYFSTFVQPVKVYKLNCKTFEWVKFYEEKSHINTDQIAVKLVFYNSYDNKKVPMFIIHKKDLVLNGNNPTYLWGYGGFNIGITPKYIGAMASFVNRGGVYAIAGLRGGNEYGENWHDDGKLKNKQNVFNDFYSAAEYLINEKYTNSSRLAADGRSNGGLLIGAAITQRPDLFKTVICGVPLLDMIRYHKFLIARFWIPEYGDPDIKEDFLTILKYSPYHNIKLGMNVPITFVYAGENDTRVDPLHAKKFVAALQNNSSQKNSVYLFMDFDSGHGSGASVEKQVDNMELRLRFIMHQLGMK